MNSSSPLWKPTATLESLRNRALIVQSVRAFFEQQGYWEVETPLLSRESIVDAWIDPIQVPSPSHSSDQSFVLQTSPEAHMKRLLSAGADRIFQLTHAFRQGEQGTRHNPEFTMLEWYACQQTDHEQMEFVESLVRYVCQSLSTRIETIPEIGDLPFERLTYQQAGENYTGTPLLELSCAELRDVAIQNSLSIPESMPAEDRDGWLNLLLAELIEPHLGQKRPTFLYDYPASQSALAIIRKEKVPVAERFELYINGIEICNGYHELGDEAELRSRFKEQNQLRQQEQKQTSPSPDLFLEAMRAGYPASSGVALGLDRLVMWLLDKQRIEDVIPFPFDRS